MLAPGAGRFLAPVLGALAVDLLASLLAGRAFALLGVILAAALLGLAVFLLIFFRDPERTPGEGVVSAADGRVRQVEQVADRWLVSVFMNVTNVHVNRVPLSARVEAIEPRGRGFRAAYRPDADRNVQQSYCLSTEFGPVEVVQITGAVARRLVSFVSVGAALDRGDRLGMIVLGSRVDVWLPADRFAPTVRVGERVTAGRTTIARPRS